MARWKLLFIITSSILLISNRSTAEQNPDFRLFEHLFSAWTHSFNHKDLKGSCDLFSLNVKANYQGVPTKNYDAICNGFKKIFQEKRSYKYHFKLHEVYRSNDLASVRITWYLQISQQGKIITKTQDEGLDVFKQDKKGNWKIVNYLAYPIK